MNSEKQCRGRTVDPDHTGNTGTSAARTMTGRIVTPKAGQDQGRAFLVIGTADDGRLLIADGKRRRIARPKKKNPAHLNFLTEPDPGTLAAIEGNRVSDPILRSVLARYRKKTEENGRF